MTEDEFLKQCMTEERIQRFQDVLTQRTRHHTVVLEDIFHEHNASACLRTCDCFGLQDVHIIESNNSFEPNPEIALGASQWLDIHRYSTVEANNESQQQRCYQRLKDQGFRIMATSPVQHSVSLLDVDWTIPTAVVFGAEQVGVSSAAIKHADALIHIPMFGFTESFNISVSVALVLQHLMSRLRTSTQDWPLKEDDAKEILSSWVRHSLGEKLGPLQRRYQQDYGNQN